MFNSQFVYPKLRDNNRLETNNLLLKHICRVKWSRGAINVSNVPSSCVVSKWRFRVLSTSVTTLGRHCLLTDVIKHYIEHKQHVDAAVPTSRQVRAHHSSIRHCSVTDSQQQQQLHARYDGKLSWEKSKSRICGRAWAELDGLSPGFNPFELILYNRRFIQSHHSVCFAY